MLRAVDGREGAQPVVTSHLVSAGTPSGIEDVTTAKPDDPVAVVEAEKASPMSSKT
jgi:hypothetical protein